MTAPTFAFPDRPTDTFPYRVEEQAGAGAMGLVYRARDVTLDRTVAIKVLKGVEDDEARQRFLQEARAAAALAHPGVTTVHQVGQIDGVPYLVMEWLDGPTLDALVRREGALPAERAGRLAIELLEALEAAHGAGVIHRDLKPANLVLSGDRLKVTDFGIARHQGRELVKTVPGQVLATPQFASPEQLEGRAVDGRSDLFSAASVAYFLLTAHYPFEGRDLGQLVTAVLTAEPVSLVERDPRLPAALDIWLARALAKRPDERFATAREMAEALRAIFEPGTAVASASGGQATAPLLVAPGRLAVFDIPVPGPAEAVVTWVAGWEARPLGELDRDELLGKLLDVPLHADPFAGVARFGDRWIFVERGVVLAVVHAETARVDPEGLLPERAPVRLHPVPADAPAGLVTLLAVALCPGTPRLAGLASEEVSLPAFVAKRLGEGFAGFASLRGSGGALALLFFQDGRVDALLSAGPWERNPSGEEWGAWLASVRATIDLHERRLRPPTSWFRRGYPDVTLRVVPPPEAEPAETSTSSISLSGVLGISGTRTSATSPFRLEGASDGVVPLAEAPAARLVHWTFAELPRLLVEQRRASAWKYLGDWLLLARRARLHTLLERPGTATRDRFDLVTESAEGKVLHLGHRLASGDAESFGVLVDRVVAAKEARIQRGDIGGVLVVAPAFDEAVFEAYRRLLHQGWGNKLLGLDRSIGYEGFVRLGSRRGFHLLLVEEVEGGFRPLFEAGGSNP